MQRGVRWTSDRVSVVDDANSERRPRLLLVCDFRPREASTVIDHIEAIRAFSRYDVFVLPTHGDLPAQLDLDRFDGLAIHYNLVMSQEAYLSPLARWRISQFRGTKAAFVQDEYRFVNRTIGVMRTMGINVLLTCVPEDQVALVYPAEALPQITRTVSLLTGYVPQQLLSLPVTPYAQRKVDVGYRGRRVPPWLGRLGREKAEIADRFAADAPAYGLRTDISSLEADRLYGQAWIEFLRNCRAMLGVESGASVFDFDGSIEQGVREAIAANPDTPFEELHRTFLAEAEGRIRLNQISPRCFEAAALGTLMVLYPGAYSGVLEPWRHYVPLEKDHSNMDEVVRAVRDPDTWEQITAQAREEVALNPAYGFQAMVEAVDEGLDLRITAPEPMGPDVFERIASRNFERMAPTQLHAFGLPPAVNRLRLIASRAPRLLTPSQTAISASADRASEKAHALRETVRYTRSLIYWAIRPGRLPWSLLRAHPGGLVGELSELGRLQEFGVNARAAGTESPFSVLVGAGDALRIVHASEVPTPSTILPRVPDDLSGVSAIVLDLTDPWLIPMGIGTPRARRLEALSTVLRTRPEVARRLLAGRAAWCSVVVSREDGLA